MPGTATATAATRCTTVTPLDENYLRGVQETDEDGWVEFTTIFPACYAGRWPHVHFEVYESLDAATSVSNKLRTSQLAFPQDVCDDVYATSGYESSVPNLAGVSLDSDGIFSDGYSLQLAIDEGQRRRGLHRDAQRAHLSTGQVGAPARGWIPACPPPNPTATSPPRTACCPMRRGRSSAASPSGSTCTCRSARCGAATATSTPTPPTSSATRSAPAGRPTPRRRSARSASPGRCWATATCRSRRSSSGAVRRRC